MSQRTAQDATLVEYDDLAAEDWPEQQLPAQMTEAQLAEHWHLCRRTLQRWRVAGYGPAWIRIGKKVVYRRGDIRDFEAAQVRR